jgi:hypothetical protein
MTHRSHHRVLEAPFKDKTGCALIAQAKQPNYMFNCSFFRRRASAIDEDGVLVKAASLEVS